MLKKLLATAATLFSVDALGQTPAQFIEGAREGLSLQTASHKATWHLGQEKRWAVDLDVGIVEFFFENGVKATAPIQVVGTYNTTDGTFLWGWDHPSIPANLRKHAFLAKEWGEKNKMPNFTSRMVKCSEDDAWSFAAVANRLAKANGVYRGPSGTALVFMTLGEVKLAKSKP